MNRLLIFIYLYMIMIFMVIQFVITPIFNPIYRYFDDQLDEDYRNHYSGFFHVIENSLKGHPVVKWEEIILSNQPQFHFPLLLKPITAITLSEKEQSELLQGKIVVRDGSNLSFFHQIGDSGMVLSMGPMPEWESHSNYTWTFILVVTVAFSIFSLIWCIPYSLKLKRISDATSEFGKGKLDARAKLPARSSLAPLADAFNAMAERIQQLINSHKELTHSISHEFRTPLARLHFGMEMLSSADKSEQKDEFLCGMKKDVNELDLLVSELLTYAKFDRQNYHPHMEKLNLGYWLSDLSAKVNTENPKISIDCRIINQTPEVLAMINPRFMERAIRNLLQNAIRYTEKQIDLTLEVVENQYVICVDDDGPGIPLADRHRIFEPFIRVETNSGVESKGYGLGLAIVRRIMEWHKGHIAVSDAPSGGARFRLSWPSPTTSEIC